MLHARVHELSGEGILKLGHNAHPPTAAHAAEDRALSKSGLSRKEDVCLPAVPLCHHTSTGERSRARRRSYTDLTAGRKEGKNSCAQHWARDCKSAHPALLPRPPPLPWLAWVASPHYHRTFDRALPPHIPAFPLLRPLATLNCCRDRQPVAVKDSENEWGAPGACELLPAARDCLRREIACGERLPAAAASLPVRKSLSRLLSCPFA